MSNYSHRAPELHNVRASLSFELYDNAQWLRKRYKLRQCVRRAVSCFSELIVHSLPATQTTEVEPSHTMRPAMISIAVMLVISSVSARPGVRFLFLSYHTAHGIGNPYTPPTPAPSSVIAALSRL